MDERFIRSLVAPDCRFTGHICRLDDGIKKDERIISVDIDPELRRRLFLEAIRY